MDRLDESMSYQCTATASAFLERTFVLKTRLPERRRLGQPAPGCLRRDHYKGPLLTMDCWHFKPSYRKHYYAVSPGYAPHGESGEEHDQFRASNTFLGQRAIYHHEDKLGYAVELCLRSWMRELDSYTRLSANATWKWMPGMARSHIDIDFRQSRKTEPWLKCSTAMNNKH